MPRLAPSSRGGFDRAVATKNTAVSLAALVLAGGVALSGLALPRRAVFTSALAPAPAPPTASASASATSPALASAGLDCEQARAIVAEVHERLAVPIDRVDDELFAELLVGWLDPHGLWSAAPDAPTGAFVYERARALHRELAMPGGACTESTALGVALESWAHELAAVFDAARAAAADHGLSAAFELAHAEIFEDDPVTTPARELARELGHRAGVFERRFASLGPELGDTARARYFPEQAAASWQRAALGAAVRAYVAAVDPHGQWVPHEEEASLYTDDPSFDGEPRLWGDMMRTAVGVRIVHAPAPPLELDDLVLAVDDVLTAGLSVEHVEELALAPVDAAVPVRRVLVLRQGAAAPQSLVVEFLDAEETEEVEALDVERVAYGAGSALWVRIPDVPEDLGHQLASVVASLDREAPPLGLLLDLRGNGGGSTEGACGALGVFLPGAPAFPLLHRGRVVEVLSAWAPARAGRWRGPVAALVDGRTASAAEMIAGGLERYQRGAAIGGRTFGKGCVQEYFDDVTGSGVLRLTTLLFALPDGASVQRTGLDPRLRLELDSPSGSVERESDLEGALEPQTGPDVRATPWLATGPAWPEHQGRVGPCSDPAICAALRRVGGSPSAVRRETGPVRRRTPGPRATKKP